MGLLKLYVNSSVAFLMRTIVPFVPQTITIPKGQPQMFGDLLGIYPTREEVNGAIQNCHTANSAQFLALIEKLLEKEILDEEDQEDIQKRKVYWVSQLDQMIAQKKEEALKEAVEDFKKKNPE